VDWPSARALGEALPRDGLRLASCVPAPRV